MTNTVKAFLFAGIFGMLAISELEIYTQSSKSRAETKPDVAKEFGTWSAFGQEVDALNDRRHRIWIEQRDFEREWAGKISDTELIRAVNATPLDYEDIWQFIQRRNIYLLELIRRKKP